MSAAAEIGFVSGEFDIFMNTPVQKSVNGTIETTCKPIAPVDQNDIEFFIPADNDSYIDLDIKFYVRGKMIMSTLQTSRT